VIKALDEMGIKIYLCASTYPDANITSKRLGIDVSNSISGFLKGTNRHDIPSFLESYQMMFYSYFGVKKLIKRFKPNFLLVTGVPTLIPRDMAKKTLVYVYFPVGLFMARQSDLDSRMKKIQVKTWQLISNINKATLLTSSIYEKNLIKLVWGRDATVIYPPCPQYLFSLSNQRENVVCTLARIVPEKGYDMILEVARRLPQVQFELVGSANPDMDSYSNKLMNIATKNVKFHINATIEEKLDVLKKSKVFLHGFVGEHFGIAIVEAMSAGAIPVTHDSGAAKEDGLVEQRFRYSDIDAATRAVSDALSFWSPQQAERLREAARNFSPQVFNEKIKSFVSKWTDRNL